MPQNTTKNILISVALIAFIISSGAFTIYQLAKRQTSTINNPQISNQTTSSTEVMQQDTFSSILAVDSSLGQPKQLIVSFDPYICGLSITGIVDKPELVQKLEFNLINKENQELKQNFTPKIDELKNFKILVDDKIVSDGIYKLEATATLGDQKIEITETTIEYKKDCDNLIKNSLPANAFSSSISSQSISSDATTQSKSTIQISSLDQTIINTSSSEASSISSQLPAQVVEAPIFSSSSSKLADNSNNSNAVRSGGLNFTTVILTFIAILSALLLVKSRFRKVIIGDVFGKNK